MTPQDIPGALDVALELDPHVLPDDDLRALVAGHPWRRVVVMGDSVAEGVREPSPGWRDLSWTDRIVAALGAEEVNLGRRNLLAHTIRQEQLEAALAARPDLVILSAGANDAMRRRFDPDAVEAELDAMVAPLRAAGADVLLIEFLDMTQAGLVPAEHVPRFDAGMRVLAGLVRSVAARHDTLLVAMRGHPAESDPALYASDRIHLSAHGHAVVATETIRVLSRARGRRR